MTKRYLGLDIEPQRTTLTVLDYDKGQLSKIQLLESRQPDLPQQLDELRTKLDGDFRMDDRLAAALPVKSAYVRSLEFPFRDSKKILAALPFEMGSLLPVAIEECVTAAQAASSTEGDTTKVTAAAVPRAPLQELLDQTDAAGIPLHLLDLTPFAYVAGLAEWCSDGILIVSNTIETTVSRVAAGTLTDYRLLPGGAELRSSSGLKALQRDIRVLTARDGDQLPTIYLMSDASADDLATPLQDMGLKVESLAMRLAGEEIPTSFIPAVALALRAAAPEETSFNFRYGPYALKGEWQKLKKSLVTAIILTLLTLLMVTSAAVITYRGKTSRVEALQHDMTNLFQQAFPKTKVVTDIPLQMQSMLRDLKERSSLVGRGQADVLAVLKAVSSLPDDIRIDVEDFGYSPGEVRMTGHAASFEAVNRVSEHLSASPLFNNVQIADAKMDIKGEQVNFRLQIALAGKGGRSQ